VILESANGALSGIAVVTVVSWVNLIYCFGVAVTFSLVFGDALAPLLQHLAIPAWAATRQAAILAVTLTMLVPLCNLSSLSKLAPISVMGVLGSMFVTAFLGVRCPAVCSSSPYAASQSCFNTYNRLQSPASLLLFSMACVSFMAHFSTSDLYYSLSKKESSSNNKNMEATTPDETVMKKYNTMTALGYGAVMILNSLALTFGFLTFGGNCEGVILSNYSSKDLGASLSRLLTAISVIGSYPLVISACRSAYFELFGTEGQKVTKEQKTRVTGMLLALTTMISLCVHDVGFVMSFNGALAGSTIIYTFPALLFLKLSKTRMARGIKLHRFLGFERLLCRFLVLFGVGAAAVGSSVSVVNNFKPNLLL